MRWPPWQRKPKDADVETAQREAVSQLEAAANGSPKVDRTVDAAEELVRRTDRFTREVERSLHLWRRSV